MSSKVLRGIWPLPVGAPFKAARPNVMRWHKARYRLVHGACGTFDAFARIPTKPWRGHFGYCNAEWVE